MIALRNDIKKIINAIEPFDEMEREHISFATKWVASGEGIFRIAKPATPDPHLVAYFLLVDPDTNHVLLVDHKKARLWLPAGGHVELNEHPMETVKRELQEELGIEASFLVEEPLFLTVTQTVGQAAGHTDVSLWYVLKGSADDSYTFDEAEFHQVRWFLPSSIPYAEADPHMKRCMDKLASRGFLEAE